MIEKLFMVALILSTAVFAFLWVTGIIRQGTAVRLYVIVISIIGAAWVFKANLYEVDSSTYNEISNYSSEFKEVDTLVTTLKEDGRISVFDSIEIRGLYRSLKNPNISINENDDLLEKYRFLIALLFGVAIYFFLTKKKNS